MNGQRIDPEKIGTPFQLLAAAMVFVLLLNGTLLSAAAALEGVPGASITLVVAAVIYPPILLGGLFVLQTKYREKLLGDDAFLRVEDRVKKLRDTVDASGFDVEKLPGGTAATGELSSWEKNEIRSRAQELERYMESSLGKDDGGRIKVVAEASRELGHAALAQGRWREGADHLADYLTVNPSDWSEWFAQGTAYANAREGLDTDTLAVLAYNRALEMLPAISTPSTKARLHTYLAGVLKRDPEKRPLAESQLEIARELAEEGSYEADDVHYNLAAILAMRGETEAAMHELHQINDPWYLDLITTHADDYFANLAGFPDFHHLLRKEQLSEPPLAE